MECKRKECKGKDCPASSSFWTHFQKMKLPLYEWDYFSRSKNYVNFTNGYFLKRDCMRMCKRCVNILRQKCFLYGSIYWYSYALIDNLKHFKSKNSKKFQRLIKIVPTVEGF